MAAAPDKPGREAGSKTAPIDLWSALALSAAALVTAYASYQAELWDGQQAAFYSQANALHTESSQENLTANQLETADLLIFSAWLNARGAGEDRLETFYHERFRPDFLRAFDAWIATNPQTNPQAPPTPFAMPDYRLAQRAHAQALDAQAKRAFEQGQDANEHGDAFVLGTVILASALFFGGINQIPHSLKTRIILLAVSAIFFVVGGVYIATLPPAP
ncbi:MAG: hypothetical protein ABUS48_01560 [Pseudomonadota bacterium]